MKLLLINIIFVSLALANGPDESMHTITDPNPVQSFISLLTSQPYPCSPGEVEKSCERNMIYEKDTESITQMVTDGRNLVSGNLDINQVLRSPSSYGGEMQTINLSSVFEGQNKFDFVFAHYTEEGKVLIEVEYNKKRYKKTIDIPK